MEADTTVAFERLVDRHRNMQEMEQYGSCAGRGLVYCGIMVVMDIMDTRARFCVVCSMCT